MNRPASLADFLQVEFGEPIPPKRDDLPSILDCDANPNSADFAKAVVNSYEFKHYVVRGLILGTIAPSIVQNFIDRAWGKAPDVVKHVGDADNPIVAEVRRVLVKPNEAQVEQQRKEEEDARTKARYVTH